MLKPFFSFFLWNKLWFVPKHIFSSIHPSIIHVCDQDREQILNRQWFGALPALKLPIIEINLLVQQAVSAPNF